MRALSEGSLATLISDDKDDGAQSWAGRTRGCSAGEPLAWSWGQKGGEKGARVWTEL